MAAHQLRLVDREAASLYCCPSCTVRPAKKPQPEPLKILRSQDQQGATYALDHGSAKYLRDEYGGAIHLVPRLFIAHETASDYNQIRDDLKAQIAQILTGLSTDALEDLAPIFFIDPVTEKKITSWRPDRT